MSPEVRTILYVDDDADDWDLLREALLKVAPEVNLTFAENGLQALEILNEIKTGRKLPCLIVLDLNMPFLDGRQTFECLKADPVLDVIPLAVLSSGENPADKALFSRAGVPYFTKPVEFAALENIAIQMADLCC